MTDGELELVFLRFVPADTGLSPLYAYELRVGGARAGHLNLRTADPDTLLRYRGQIGYAVEPAFRGHHFAERAVRLVLPRCRELGLDPVWITCDPDNAASIRTLERLGAERVEEVDIPPGEGTDGTRKIRWRLRTGS